MKDRLLLIQTRESLTDTAMADRLGLSRPTWNLIKNGRVRLSGEVAIRAAGAFPELADDLLELAAASA